MTWRPVSIAELRHAYRTGRQTPAGVVAAAFDRIERDGLSPVWISLADRTAAIARASAIDPALPLGGVPCAIKDNIDVEGMLTTAGCESFAYRATRTAPVVSRLLDAGAVLIGKTNLDQFATGLVGTRSPYGACASVFDDRFISGGSSSGSAVAVASGLCAFALGTDTAGSGRVPAAFNGIVGVKPTRGMLSTSGVVPACRSLDCVSIFTANAADGREVLRIAQAFDPDDPGARSLRPGDDAAPWASGGFRFGVPAPDALEFFGDGDRAAPLYEQAARRLETLGGTRVRIDFAPFRSAGELLYGPWVAERLSGLATFLARNTDDVHPVVRSIVLGGAAYSAVDAHRAADRLRRLMREADVQWEAMDLLLLPTAGAIYTRSAVEQDPVGLNASLGYYTSFVNLMDLAAVAVPAGVRADGLPFGVSLVGRACSDAGLLALAERFLGERDEAATDAPGCVALAVVGAHLSGQPLNHQITGRGARLVRTCRTARCYRLFALPGTIPPKPGLRRVGTDEGSSIEVEVWSMPEDQFGSFTAAVPSPLGIGTVELDTGEWVKGFICESFALDGAEDITRYGGWRPYLAARYVPGARRDVVETATERT